MADTETNGATTRRSQQRYGVLTKTLITSPVIRWILPARIRHRRLNDVVFVGEDFVEVKQVRKGGHIEHVISKRDFGSSICAANVFSIDDLDVPDVDDLLPQETRYEDIEGPILPAQLLVLTLAESAVLFLFLHRQDNGLVVWKQLQILLPRSLNALNHIGVHLAIDPRSRAMAVASRGGQVILYSAKDRQAFREELLSGTDKWCPVKEEQLINDSGIFAHISFLHPRLNDQDHVILMLVVVDKASRRMKLKWFDWRVALGIRKLQMHDPIPLEASKCVPSMVIPLSNAVFLLVHQNRIDMWRELLTNSPRISNTWSIDQDCAPLHPGISPRLPVWSHWCRPSRTRLSQQECDVLYLCREDGLVFHMDVNHRGFAHAVQAGQLNCHVGEAFASLGDDKDPDLLAVASDSSTGRIVSIGSWPAMQTINQTRVETMTPKLVELLPNWTAVTDVAIARIPSKENRANRAHDSIFVSSGRQPYGTITELRQGVEARMHTYFSLPEKGNLLDLCVMLDPTVGSIILLFSTPESTTIWNVSGAAADTEITQEAGVFATSSRTLVAGTTYSHQLVQVTDTEVVVAGRFDASFEDVERCSVSRIYCAVLEPSLNIVACCEYRDEKPYLSTYLCHPDTGLEGNLIHKGVQLELPYRPLSMASAVYKSKALLLVAYEDAHFELYVGAYDTMSLARGFDLPVTHESCDQLALLTADPNDHTLLAVCSFRDGMLATIAISMSPEIVLGTPSMVPFGQSTVRLLRLPQEPDRVYAMCGTDTCVLSLDTKLAHGLEIQRIWAADKERPDLAQTQIFACARLPPVDDLSSYGNLHTYGDSFAMLSGDELWLTFLEHHSAIVPRQFRVSGSPFRLIYAPAHHKLVCASLVTELNEQGTKRRCTPVIDLVSPSNGKTRSYRLDPGEEVYSLLEWAPLNTEKDKSYRFILVGSKHLRQAKHSKEMEVRGRISFLNRVKDAIESQWVLYLDAPVYAMAMFDSLTFAICSGNLVSLHRMSWEKAKLQQICAPMLLSSPASTISCQGSMLYVTTMKDSHLTIRVQERQTNGNGDPYELVVTSTSPRADDGVSHTILTVDETPLVLMTTSAREIIGLTLPSVDDVVPGHPRPAKIAFEGSLPQSIIRVKQCAVRPAWKQSPGPGVVCGNLIGSCTDGSVVGLSILDEQLWRRLFWLQRLVERSPTLSRISPRSEGYLEDNDDGQGTDRSMPIGLGSESEIILSSPYDDDTDARDMHIDGNVLSRLLACNGVSAIRLVIQEAAQERGPVGEWMRAHLAEELDMAEECAAELTVLLDSWL